MNNYIIFVDGNLAAPTLFEVKEANNTDVGRYLTLTPKKKTPCTSIDVLDIRASSITRRLRWEGEGTAKERYDCLLVPNPF